MKLLTIREIAQQLNLAESTIKGWRDRYPEYMPTVTIGRYPKYEPEALEIFKIIGDGISNGLQRREIAEQLSAKYAINTGADANEISSSDVAATQQRRENVTSKDHCKLIAALRDEIFFLRGQVNQLQNDNRQLTSKMLQLQAPAKLSLWEKIIGKK